MKRKRALLFFGSLTLLVLGYVAWCGRSMYLSVPVPELTQLPPELREDAREIIVARGLTRPDRFDMRVFRTLLANPYESEPWPIWISSSPRPPEEPDFISVRRNRRSYRAGEGPVQFFKREDHWYSEPASYNKRLARQLQAR